MKLILFFILTISSVPMMHTTIIEIPEDQPTIQAGIDVSMAGDTILVQTGTYVENINFNGKNITVSSLFCTTQDTTYISQTIIDGDSNGSVVTFENEEDTTAVLTGFTITNGLGDGLGGGYNGGGITCKDYSNPSLLNNVITSCHSFNGGGIYCLNHSSPIIMSVIIKNNTGVWGYGISCEYTSHPNMVNVIISGNSVEPQYFIESGALYCWNSNPNLKNVTIAGNSGGSSGIYCYNSNPNLENVIITNNTLVNFTGQVGGIYCYANSHPNLVNVTITNNYTDSFNGGIYCQYSSGITLVNCIIWNNSPNEIVLSYDDSNLITIYHSDIQGGEASIIGSDSNIVNWLEGNIDEDPLFVNAESGDYHLMDDSPCIDSGTAYFVWEGTVYADIESDNYYGWAPDMGSYEWNGTKVENLQYSTNNIQLEVYPNPFQSSTTIQFTTENTEKNTEILIYNIKGQKVKTMECINYVDAKATQSLYSIQWDGKDDINKPVSSGIYFINLRSGKQNIIKKTVLMR